MTVAIVHDFLTQRGGAERVVLHLAEMVHDPIIVTSCYAPDSTYPEFQNLPVWADELMAERGAEQFRRRAFSYGKAFRKKDLSFADAVIVSSSSFAHHIVSDRALIIWHTPPRFLYDPGAYFKQPLVAKGFELATTGYRRQDKRAALGHHKHLAVSERTAGRLRSAYGIDPDVLHPPFDSEHFSGDMAAPPASPRALVVSRLLPYKRVDLAIEACAQAGVPLTVIGQGPDEDRLRAQAGSTVTFVPEVSEQELLDAYEGHTLVLNPAIDDFGYIPLESAARGRPVVAAREGGAAETVADGVTGFLVEGDSVHSWAGAIRQTVAAHWDVADMRQAITRFDSKHFDQGLVRAMCSGGDEDLLQCFNFAEDPPLEEPAVSAAS